MRSYIRNLGAFFVLIGLFIYVFLGVMFDTWVLGKSVEQQMREEGSQ